jgi:hypothetical protein
MCKFTEKELEEIFRMLERAGMNPMWCDTPVPYYDVNIPAGVPTDVGEVMEGEYLMLPKALVGMDPTMVLNVRGDSMKDAGISSGDRMEVRFTPDARDGDIVVAEVDGQCTVKTLFTDEQGDHWLVPSNEAYDAIRLTEEMQVRIVGVVIGIVKDLPRTSFNTCVKSVRRTMEVQARTSDSEAEPTLTPVERMARAVREVQPLIKQQGHWLAIYRILADAGIIRTYRELPDYIHHTLGIAESELAHPIKPESIGKAALNKGLPQEKSFDYWQNAKAKPAVAPYWHIANRFKELAGV